MNTKPNIIFVFTDQQSANMLSCTGNQYLKTPAMDYLAENGVRFERAYCTNSVCLPSRFSLMTGRMPSYVNIRSNSDVKKAVMPEHIFKNGIGYLLKDAGYDAVYGGKVHLPGFNPEDIGFDTLCKDQRQNLSEACSSYIRNHSNENPFFMVASFINPHDICFMAIRDFADADSASLTNVMPQGMSEYEIDEIQEKCRSLLKRLEDGDTLMQMLLNDSTIYEKEHFYNDLCPPLPANFEPQENEPEAIGMLLDERPFRRNARENYSDKRWKLHRWLYCRLTEIVDRQIQELIDALKESGKEEDTVIIFSSDHGDHDGAHRLEHKSTLYEEACRIPLIISQKGKTNCCVDKTHLISNGLDLIPTICDYAGIVHPEKDLEGISLKPLAEGKEPADWRRAVKLESETGRAIVFGDYKYALYFEGENREQLYNLKEEAVEMRNALFDRESKEAVKEAKTYFEHIFG